VGQRFLLDVAPTGVQHYVDIDSDGDAITLIEHTPTSIESEILDDCARKRSLVQGRGRLLQHAAQIPINTYYLWKMEWRRQYRDYMTWPEFEVMKLNSRDVCKLRTGYQRSVFGKKL
jgi:hypothetical protein